MRFFSKFSEILRWRNSELRSKVEKRAPQSDDKFVAALQPLRASPTVAITMRRVIADMCGVEAKSIHESDSFDVLNAIICSGLLLSWDELDFIFRLEAHLERRLLLKPNELPPIFMPPTIALDSPTPRRLDEWLRSAAPVVEIALGSAMVENPIHGPGWATI